MAELGMGDAVGMMRQMMGDIKACRDHMDQLHYERVKIDSAIQEKQSETTALCNERNEIMNKYQAMKEKAEAVQFNAMLKWLSALEEEQVV